MKFSTPGGIYPTVISVFSADTAFVLGHPIADGPVDMDTSFLFVSVAGEARHLKTFPFEITGIASLNNILYLVDGDADMHEYSAGQWKLWEGVGRLVARINALRALDGHVYGLAGDGLVYEWTGTAWSAMVDKTEGLYLYDIAAAADGTLLVSGENGHLSQIKFDQLVPIELATNADISSVLPLPDGSLVLTGWRATVLFGNAVEMADLRPEGREDAFANAVCWSNKILIGTVNGILELRDRQLLPFSNHPAQRLAAGHGQLWLQHDDGVAVFDGKLWRAVPLTVDM